MTELDIIFAAFNDELEKIASKNIRAVLRGIGKETPGLPGVFASLRRTGDTLNTAARSTIKPSLVTGRTQPYFPAISGARSAMKITKGSAQDAIARQSGAPKPWGRLESLKASHHLDPHAPISAQPGRWQAATRRTQE